MTSERFRPCEHIKTQSDFSRVYTARCSAADDVLVVYVRPNQLTHSRFGISVAKRVGRAVDRVYVRRRVREAFRRNKKRFARGFDIICVARTHAKDRRVDVTTSLTRLVEKAVSRWDRRERKSPPSSDKTS